MRKQKRAHLVDVFIFGRKFADGSLELKTFRLCGAESITIVTCSNLSGGENAIIIQAHVTLASRPSIQVIQIFSFHPDALVECAKCALMLKIPSVIKRREAQCAFCEVFEVLVTSHSSAIADKIKHEKGSKAKPLPY
jgi:hypothetical protein